MGIRSKVTRHKGMGHKEDIMGRRGCMGSRRGSIWMIGGEGMWGLQRRCVRVWRVVVVWMLVCYFKAVRERMGFGAWMGKERSYEGRFEAGRMFEGEEFIHRWMDGWKGIAGLVLYFTTPKERRIRVGVVSNHSTWL